MWRHCRARSCAYSYSRKCLHRRLVLIFAATPLFSRIEPLKNLNGCAIAWSRDEAGFTRFCFFACCLCRPVVGWSRGGRVPDRCALWAGGGGGRGWAAYGFGGGDSGSLWREGVRDV